MTVSPDPAQPPQFPSNARDFLSHWTASRGNIRSFVEDYAAPPLGEKPQREAGKAAAEAAVAELFGIDIDEYVAGADSVHGAREAAGASRLTTPDPDIPVDPGAAAFFDVDNTLIQGSSLVQLAMGLTRQKFFRLRDIAPMVYKQAKFRLIGAESSHDITAGRQQALEFIRGRRVDELTELGREIVDKRMIAKLYSGTRDLAQMHIDAGQQVWLVTATPVQLAQILAERLGFTGALGTVPEQVDGVFTGRLVGDILHGPGKKHAVAALSSLEGLDLSRCTAYSDSSNDIPMLSMVGTAVAINPDRALKKEALRRGWIVRDYRSVRRAVRTYGLPALATAGISLASLKLRRARRRR
ncbi:HAD-IB family hydrolase [Corynebacterium yudongzhengii]|uniref:HAD-IB family hydrolase n=1 Tax=Corynebacterium yudongzhengii TaxID=2080740 RepID=A0A2U1T9K6_9CORY|nr:HAD-IB family hydrolase [Corynebacterium yudongzhengii]AWB81158.1 HAD-IB family hydrolase [Corynebacterium yudongzhengii]PWC02697.1 HAD-IB family hydrolase [Corynebacterium yudongzhengii]